MTSDAEMLVRMLPPRRLQPYLRRSQQDAERALDYYRWSHAMASECWTVIAHFEVLLRHRIDEVMTARCREPEVGIPWFFQTSALPQSARDPLASQIDRLIGERRLERDRVIAGMTFGFWKSFFGDDALWRESLHAVFPNRAGLQRKDVTARLESIRKFLNRVAHHDSLLNVDIPHEIRSILELTRAMDTDYAQWLEAGSSWLDVYSESPHRPADTVVVAAREAWPLYSALCDREADASPAYICQAGRFFKPVERLAFYSDQMIHAEVPQALDRVDNVDWTLQNAAVLEASTDRQERKIAALIRWSAGAGSVHFDFDEDSGPSGRFQVFFLTSPGHPRHKTLPFPVPHRARGRGTAFTQRQRYVASHSLDTAASTEDLTDV